ncbi:MAG: hypothetical protein J6T15_03870 [Bacilli bacterium]|nr:hypothetical protein [Bacilli bacterium]
MDKIYIIRYEDNCSGEISSGIINGTGYTTLEKAREVLDYCVGDDIIEYEENNNCYVNVIKNENEVIIEIENDYNKYTIEELIIEK